MWRSPMAEMSGMLCWHTTKRWLTIERLGKRWCRCFYTFSFENACSSVQPEYPGWSCLLTCPSSVHYWLGCVWQHCSKWDDSQISGASLFVSDSSELWKASPQQNYICLLFNVSFNAKEKLFLWHRWWDGVSVIHLTNEDSILVKRKPYPLPPVITVSMKSFPIIPLKTTPTSNMNYTPFHYEKHYIKHPIHETLECRSIYTWKLNSSWNILVWSMKNNQQWNMQPPSFNSASWSELSR